MLHEARHKPQRLGFMGNDNSQYFHAHSFLQILTELDHSGVGRNKEQAAKLLGHLVATAPRLIRPYMEPILKVWQSYSI